MAMTSILTPEDVVRRIAAERTFIDERGAVGIRLEPAAIVRHYGEQFRSLCSHLSDEMEARPHRSCDPRAPPGGLAGQADRKELGIYPQNPLRPVIRSRLSTPDAPRDVG
jgi:hypothetical protein